MVILFLWLLLSVGIAFLGEKRKIGYLGSLLICILLSPLIGLIITLLSKEKTESNKHKYKSFQELGKKAEYKGQLAEAINYYMDSLYHLENDYNNLSSNDNQARINLINKLKQKVDSLKSENKNEF